MDTSDFSGFKNATVAEIGFSAGLKNPGHPFESDRWHIMTLRVSGGIGIHAGFRNQY